MTFQHESGFNLEYSGSFDFENPEERFMYPRLTRLNTWLIRSIFEEADVNLAFTPGIFIFSELSCDDRDTNSYSSRYITTLLPLLDERAPDWFSPSVSVDRQEMRPLPAENAELLRGKSHVRHLAFDLLLQNYVSTINERTDLRLFFNESYNIYASFDQSFDEFREHCISCALQEKSELALKLAQRFDREIQQLDASVLHQAEGTADGELSQGVLEKIEALQLAGNRLLNKAISLHVLDVNVSDEASIRWTNYTDTLQEVADNLDEGLEKYNEEFSRFATSLIERFSEIERETNEKALDIETLEIPLSSCSMRILRVEKVWLPQWNIRYMRDGKPNERSFRAY
jgi:hypothetical protein